MTECPNCGADMKHSPCCGRVAAYGDMKESLRLEVLENTTLRAQVDQLRKERDDLRTRAENAEKERDEACRLLEFTDQQWAAATARLGESVASLDNKLEQAQPKRSGMTAEETQALNALEGRGG